MIAQEKHIPWNYLNSYHSNVTASFILSKEEKNVYEKRNKGVYFKKKKNRAKASNEN